MLAASVSGDIFASPSANQILTAIELALLASSPDDTQRTGSLSQQDLKQVLLIINNYTGDRLNFGLALTRARSLYPRLAIDYVVVADDVSLLKSDSASLVGPRGLAGNILVCKILDAYVQTGAQLGEVKRLGDAVVRALRSVGVSLDHCHVPGRQGGEDEAKVGDEEVLAGEKGARCEVGMGLHNEPGVRRGRFGSAEELVGEMLDLILTSGPGKRGAEVEVEQGAEEFVRMGKTAEDMDEVVLFANNLGGMSQLEMGAVVEEMVMQLRKPFSVVQRTTTNIFFRAGNINIHPRRIYSSSYMTSLNASGFSLSILNISSIRRTLSTTRQTTPPVEIVDVLALLDAPTTAHSWLGTRSWPTASIRSYESEEAEADRLLRLVNHTSGPQTEARESTSYWRDADISVNAVENGIRCACEKVLQCKDEMTRFDMVVGDGDCGETFAKGARGMPQICNMAKEENLANHLFLSFVAVLQALDSGDLDVNTLGPPALMRHLGAILEDNMGGTIGAILAIFFTSLFAYVPSSPSQAWHTSPYRALSSLSAHTPAKPGDRTIVDALGPFCDHLATCGDDGVSAELMDTAVKKARDGAEGTRGMKAKLGRAVYAGVGGNSDAKAGPENGLPPDPGAWGVAAVVEGFWEGMKKGVI